MAKRQSDPKAYLTRFYPAVVVAALVALGGCGASADDTTCGEYADMEFEEQTAAIQSVLAEHDLDENDTGNIRSLKASVASFCGSGSSVIPGSGSSTLVTETTNPDGKLGDGGDWSGSHWRPKDPTTLDLDYE